MITLNPDKLAGLPTGEELLTSEYGAKGTQARTEFDAKAQSWYYAEILKDKRKELHITQEALAKKVGVERAYIAKLEKGETDMHLSTFFRIAHALGVNIAIL